MDPDGTPAGRPCWQPAVCYVWVAPCALLRPARPPRPLRGAGEQLEVRWGRWAGPVPHCGGVARPWAARLAACSGLEPATGALLQQHSGRGAMAGHGASLLPAHAGGGCSPGPLRPWSACVGDMHAPRGRGCRRPSPVLRREAPPPAFRSDVPPAHSALPFSRCRFKMTTRELLGACSWWSGA